MSDSPSIVASVDPGLRLCGLAIFTDGVLTGAHSIAVKERFEGPEAYWRIAREVLTRVGESVPGTLVIETPQQYAMSPAPRGQVQALEGVVGALTAVFAPGGTSVVSYLPREWKGQLPKDVAFVRILSRLAPSELLVEPNLLAAVRHPASKWGHVADAVGIGLHHLGRLGTRLRSSSP